MASRILTVFVVLVAAMLVAALHQDTSYDTDVLQYEVNNAEADLASALIEVDVDANVEAEADADAEFEADADAEMEADADAETEADVEEVAEDAPAPAVAPANTTVAAAGNATVNATASTATPITSNVTIPGLGSVNVTAHPELKAIDMDDQARVMYLALHDGRTGSVKPLIPVRKGEKASHDELAQIAQNATKVQLEWEQRAVDEQRTKEVAEHEILKAAGMLPPPVTSVTPQVGLLSPDVPSVPAGTDLQEVKANCNTTIVTAPTPAVPLTEMLLDF